MADLRRRRPGLADQLDDGLRGAVDGDPAALVELADLALAPVGGRLVAGYRQDGSEAFAALQAARTATDEDSST